MTADPYPVGDVSFELLDEHVEMSIYSLSLRSRRRLRVVLVLSVAATITLSVCDPILDVRLTIPALLYMSVANLCAISLLFAKRLIPVHEAFRYGYKSGRADERINWCGDL
jgi:hypothetical protein